MKVNNSIIAFFIIGFVSAQKVWSFNDCLSYARENNLQILASKLNEQVQESNYKIAKKEKLPDVKGTIGNNFTFGPLTTQKINSSGSLGLSINSDYKYTEGYQNNLALESSILLYNNGRLRLNEEKNNFLLQQNQYTTEKIKNDIALQLVGNYLTILLNKELLIVESNSMDTQQQDADRNEKLYKAGSIPLSTLYETKSNLANSKQLYENARIEIDRSLMVLAMLLQKDYRDFQIEDAKVSDDIGMPLINIDDIVNYAYNNQPEIKSAELGIEASKKDIDLAKTAFYPTITGGYKASTYYQDYFDRASKSLEDQWYDNHSQILSVGVSIPIFNKGISKIKVEQSKINQFIQENKLDQEKLNLKQTIQTSYFDVTSSYQKFVSAKELVASTKLSYEFALKSFTAGKINIYDLNIARNNYFNAQSQMLQAKYSFLFRLKILDFYTGKPLEITSEEKLNYNNLTPNTNTVQAMESDSNNGSTTNVESEPEIVTPQKGNNVVTKAENINPEIIINNQKEENTLKTQNGEKEKQHIKISSSDKNSNVLYKDEETKTTKTSDEKSSVNTKVKNTSAEPIISDSQTTSTKAKNEEDAKREALIKERRAKLSKGID